MSYLLSGLFSRACRSLGNTDKLSEIQSEAASLRDVLVQRYRSVAVTLEGELAGSDGCVGPGEVVGCMMYWRGSLVSSCLALLARRLDHDWLGHNLQKPTRWLPCRAG